VPCKLTCSYAGMSLLSTTHRITFSISLLTPYVDEVIGAIKVDFDVINQILITYFVFIKYLIKM